MTCQYNDLSFSGQNTEFILNTKRNVSVLLSGGVTLRDVLSVLGIYAGYIRWAYTLGIYAGHIRWVYTLGIYAGYIRS